MIEPVRKFAIIVLDDLYHEIDRMDLSYVESPKNLGSSLQFTTLESRLTTHITSIKEVKQSVSFNINFIPPNAYQKLKAFRLFVQKYLNHTTALEYSDTDEVYLWEGKVQKIGYEELSDWGGLVCSVSFMPTSPKCVSKVNEVHIYSSQSAKVYPYGYPYQYTKPVGTTAWEIDNRYFEDIPLKILIYGRISQPSVILYSEEGPVYSLIQFTDLTIPEGGHVLVDSVQSKIMLWDGSEYRSAYDYVDKSPRFDTFLFARASQKSRVLLSSPNPDYTGYMIALYRQYTL